MALFLDALSFGGIREMVILGIDSSNNKSRVSTQVYQFECPKQTNAKSVGDYPECKILECEMNFELRNDTCVAKNGSAESGDYRDNAFTAPLFSSDTPLVVSTKSISATIMTTRTPRGETGATADTRPLPAFFFHYLGRFGPQLTLNFTPAIIKE